jgi:hypothetical protein
VMDHTGGLQSRPDRHRSGWRAGNVSEEEAEILLMNRRHSEQAQANARII